MSVYDKLYELNRAELEDVIAYYDDYVYECMMYYGSGSDEDRLPVGIEEFIDNDYEFIKGYEKELIEEQGGIYVEIKFY